MINPLIIWDEVIQRNISISENKIEDVLEFPEKIIIGGKRCKKLRIETAKCYEGYLSRFYNENEGNWEYLKSNQPNDEGICNVHADALNFLKGEYVKQHRDSSE